MILSPAQELIQIFSRLSFLLLVCHVQNRLLVCLSRSEVGCCNSHYGSWWCKKLSNLLRCQRAIKRTRVNVHRPLYCFCSLQRKKRFVLCQRWLQTCGLWSALILACRKMIVAYYWGWASGLSSLGAAESSKTMGIIDIASITRLSSGSSYAFQLQEHFRNHNRKPLQKEQTNTLMVSGGSSNSKYQGSF